MLDANRNTKLNYALNSYEKLYWNRSFGEKALLDCTMKTMDTIMHERAYL